MQDKLIITLERLKEDEFLAKSGYIVASLKDNPNFPEPWPPSVASLAQLGAAFDAYRAAYHAALTHDTLNILHRKVTRHALTAMLKRLATYLELAASGEVEKLETSGFDLRRDTVHSAIHDAPDMPESFRVEHGSLSGSLNVHAASIHGGGNHDIEIAQGDPQLAANWHHALSAPSGAPMRLDGLPPGQTYWVRLRSINKYGPGPWTSPACIIVI